MLTQAKTTWQDTKRCSLVRPSSQRHPHDDHLGWNHPACKGRHYGQRRGRFAAIATAKRLGAVVYASDVRKSAAEQIESVGGRFIEVDGMDDFEDESGYAKPLTPEFIQKVNDTVCGVAADADIIVTTARIFGRPAPITVPSSAVANFKSVPSWST